MSRSCLPVIREIRDGSSICSRLTTKPRNQGDSSDTGDMASSPHEVLFGHLPEGILCEDHINIPGLDYPVPRDPAEWEKWAVRTLVQRERVHALCENDADSQRVYRNLCKQPHGIGVAFFLIMFGWIYEPREDDDVAMMPFLLYPRQIEMLFALDGVMQRPKGWDSSIAFPKARGVGATWVVGGDRVHRWLFKKSFQGRVVSRNEDMVDKPGSSDAWMYKFDYLIDRLPHWLVPQGYSTKRGSGNRYRTHMTMINPETNSAIMGEATTSGVGVGGRATCYDIDEAARFKNLRQVDAQLAETTNHRVRISTHNIEETTDFWDMCNGINDWPPTVVFEMPWDSVITRDQEWLEATRLTLPKDMFEREVMMNPWEGISGWVYPKSKTLDLGSHYHRRDLGVTLHGLDDGWDDEFAVIWAQWDRAADKLIILDGYQNSHQPIAYYGHLFKGIASGNYEWDMEARRLLRWINDNQTHRGIYVGDRHGDNTDLTSGESPWSVLQNKFGIHVLTNPPEYTNYRSRRDALSDLLDRIEFADTPGAAQVLHAIQNHRFPKPRNGAQPTAEVRRPIHDHTSHFTTALEYLAVYVTTHSQGGIAGATPQKAVNNNWLSSRRALPTGRRRSPSFEVTPRW